MIKRRKFLEISVLGAGTIVAGSQIALSNRNSNDFIEKTPSNQYIPIHEGIKTEEIKRRSEFVEKYILMHDEYFFSFLINNISSNSFLKSWVYKKGQKPLDTFRTEHTLIWSDPSTSLELKCIAVEYIQYPVLEWTLYFTNTGKIDSPIIENINAVDISIERQQEKAVDLRFDKSGETEFVLNTNTGDVCREYSFEPHHTRLDFNQSMRIAPVGGRPSNVAFPYFNLGYDGESGIIAAIGWPGQWFANFQRDNASKLRITAGQETTHFKLLPGEVIRTPLVTLQFYKGTYIHSQNIWRRWMVEHNLYKSKGKILEPFSATCMGFEENETDEKKHIDNYIQAKSGIDYWWMDAGWYPWGDNKNEGWETLATGTWRPDIKRFPNGLKPVSDYVHSKGLKYILWFEPERVSPASDLYEKKNYLLHIKSENAVYRNEQNMREKLWVDNEAKRNQIRKGDALYNFGDKEAREFITGLISKCISDYNLDIYRHDFNISPLEFWKEADTPDRSGIAENKYVSGLLQFWDDLLKMHPNIYIDTCASGGRRVDLETLRRAYPLLCSDYQFDPVGNQAHNYGLAPWIPFFGTGLNATNIYNTRTAMNPCFGLGFLPSKESKPEDWVLYRRLMEEWKQIAAYFCGDYYPLTSFSMENDVWIGWQYHRPDLNEGFIQMFRREESSYTNARFQIKGLKESVNYSILNLDKKDSSIKMKGKEMMEIGLAVEIPVAPGSSLIIYKKIKT